MIHTTGLSLSLSVLSLSLAQLSQLSQFSLEGGQWRKTVRVSALSSLAQLLLGEGEGGHRLMSHLHALKKFMLLGQVISRQSFVVSRQSLLVRRSSFVVRRSSFVVRRSSFVVRC